MTRMMTMMMRMMMMMIDSGGEGGLSTLCGAEEKPCSGNITVRYENEGQAGSNSYKYIFMAAQLLHGAGAAPLYTLGVTYIDENVGPASSAFYLGIFYTMAIVGPAIGYSVGGHFLTFHTDFLEEASSDSSSWVGAWWLPFVICGAAFLLVSIPRGGEKRSYGSSGYPAAKES